MDHEADNSRDSGQRVRSLVDWKWEQDSAAAAAARRRTRMGCGHAFRELTISSLVMKWPSVRKRTVLTRDSWPGVSVRMSA